MSEDSLVPGSELAAGSLPVGGTLKRKQQISDADMEEEQKARRFARNRALWREPVTHLVHAGQGTHAANNPDYICYTGEELVGHDPTDGEVRWKALEALEDMLDQFDADFPEKSIKKYMPEAMGVQVVREDSTTAHKIYYHSSMKQNVRHDWAGVDLTLVEPFRNLVVDDEGNTTAHRRQYRCVEPGLFTNSESSQPASSSGSRIYIVNACGQFLPPCEPSSNAPEDEGKIGCDHLVATLDAIKIKDGPAMAKLKKSRGGDAAWFVFQDFEQVRTTVDCRIGLRNRRNIVRRILDKITITKAPGSADPQYTYAVEQIAERMIERIEKPLADKATNKGKITTHFPIGAAIQRANKATIDVLEGRVHGVEKITAQTIVDEIKFALVAVAKGTESGVTSDTPALVDSATTTKVEEAACKKLIRLSDTLTLVDSETLVKIDAAVRDVFSFLADRLAKKPGPKTPRDYLGYWGHANSGIPLVSPLTVSQHKTMIKRKNEEEGPSEFLKRMEAEIQADMDAGREIAFPRDQLDELERQIAARK